MTDFQAFINANGLKKGKVANFLNVSNAFITQLCSGAKLLPAAKLALIKANTFGWNISMFETAANQTTGDNNSGVIINRGGNHGKIDNRHYYSNSPDVLRAQVAQLDELLKEKEERLKEKDAQIKEKDAQIKQLLDILQGKQ